VSTIDVADPREQRALALKRLEQGQYDLGCALGYLRNSDEGSRVIDDLLGIKDKTEDLIRTLEWRQRRDDTP
jgi:hypothetical protein